MKNCACVAAIEGRWALPLLEKNLRKLHQKVVQGGISGRRAFEGAGVRERVVTASPSEAVGIFVD